MPADLGVTANTFASFAEIMTGFSFTALTIYLAYEAAKGRHRAEDQAKTPDNPPETKENGERKPPVIVGAEHPISRSDVSSTLLYVIPSLAISSFVYASMTSLAGTPAKVVAVLVMYGVVFGTAVLAFFYALTLMTYQNPVTRKAALHAYLVVVIAGPIVVLRFLIDAVQNAWDFKSASCYDPESWSEPTIAGAALVGLFLMIAVTITQIRIFERWRRLWWLCNLLCARPMLPAGGTFAISVCVAVGVLWINEAGISFAPAESFVWVSLFAGSLLLGGFALACGCVVGPRISQRPAAFPAWSHTGEFNGKTRVWYVARIANPGSSPVSAELTVRAVKRTRGIARHGIAGPSPEALPNIPPRSELEYFGALDGSARPQIGEKPARVKVTLATKPARQAGAVFVPAPKMELIEGTTDIGSAGMKLLSRLLAEVTNATDQPSATPGVIQLVYYDKEGQIVGGGIFPANGVPEDPGMSKIVGFAAYASGTVWAVPNWPLPSAAPDA